MSLIKEKFNTSIALPSIFPAKWSDSFTSNDNVLFDNLDQFIFTVSKLKQRQDENCDIAYKDALRKLIRRESDFPESEQDSIRNLVRNNLLKRGLITEEVYENFRYSHDGTQVGIDVGKYAAGEADCVITPNRQYIDFFYEIYVNVSYSWSVSNDTIRKNVAKLLATIEELERKHVFIKINAILPISGPATIDDTRRNFFSAIPIFSHKDHKSVAVMSSVINERLLRKFYFAVLEDLYGSDLSSGYGHPVQLEKSMNIGNTFDEVELFESIMKTVGA